MQNANVVSHSDKHFHQSVTKTVQVLQVGNERRSLATPEHEKHSLIAVQTTAADFLVGLQLLSLWYKASLLNSVFLGATSHITSPLSPDSSKKLA